MRPFEYALYFVSIALAATLFLRDNSARRIGITSRVLAAIIIIFHFVFEGYRWHMLPAYCLLSLSLLIGNSGSRSIRNQRRRLGTIIILLLLFSMILPVYLFPVFRLEKPTGPYPVGTTSRYLIDHSRSRDLMIQIWYPAEAGGGSRKAPYHPHADYLADELSDAFGLPRLMFSNFEYVMSNSLLNARVSRAQSHYPVLLFSHGLYGYRFQNSFQAEELASQGYIIVAIDHAPASSGTVFPGGRTVPRFRLDHLTEDRLRPLIAEWSGDARFVLDQLELLTKQDPENMFTDRLDLNRVGYFGHSLGGAAAADALSRDPRFKAGVDLDGYPFGTAYKRGLRQPFMHLESDRSDADVSDRLLESLQMSREELHRSVKIWQIKMQRLCRHGLIIKVRGSKHFDFSDCPLWTPFARLLGLTGDIGASRMHQIVNQYTLAFFEKNLNGRDPVVLKDSSTAFPEVDYRDRR